MAIFAAVELYEDAPAIALVIDEPQQVERLDQASQLLERTGQSIGVFDADFTIEAGEMTGDLALITTLPNPKKLSTRDFILAIGGGSVIDGSKFIAAVLCYDGDPLDLLTGTKASAALPLGCVLTLAATGSEST